MPVIHLVCLLFSLTPDIGFHRRRRTDHDGEVGLGCGFIFTHSLVDHLFSSAWLSSDKLLNLQRSHTLVLLLSGLLPLNKGSMMFTTVTSDFSI